MHERRQNLMLFAERASWAIGLAGVIWLGALPDRGCHDGTAGSRTFRGASAQDRLSPNPISRSGLRSVSLPGSDAIREPAAAPLAVLRIPIFVSKWRCCGGRTEFVLNRGLGHIEETALPGSGGEFGHRRPPRWIFPRAEGCCPRRCRGARDPRGPSNLSHRADVDRRTRRRVGAGSDARSIVDPRHLLSVLLHRFRPTAVHRPRRPCRRSGRPGFSS